MSICILMEDWTCPTELSSLNKVIIIIIIIIIIINAVLSTYIVCYFKNVLFQNHCFDKIFSTIFS